MNSARLFSEDRSQIGWWIFTLVVSLLILFVLSFVIEAVALGLFIYYTMRPLHNRLHRIIRASGVAAAVTLLGIALPLLIVTVYVGLQAVQEMLRSGLNWVGILEFVFGSALVSTLMTSLRIFEHPREPIQIDSTTLNEALARGTELLAPIGDAIVTMFLATALAFFLLRDGNRLVAWVQAVLGDPDQNTLYRYARAVDHDLQSIYLGHVANAALVGIGATIVYNGFNFLVSSAVTIPLPTLLGILTGVASLVPIIVGKLVYVPLSLYLGVVTLQTDASLLPVLVLFVISFIFLDIVPQIFLRPYLAGRQLHVGLVMFSYVVGTLVFGWDGLFLGPLLLVIGLHLLGIVVPKLIHGEPVTPTVDSDPFATEVHSENQVEGSSSEDSSS